jgi:hypothetical protein
MYHKPDAAKKVSQDIAAAHDEKLGAREDTSVRTSCWHDKRGRTYLLGQSGQQLVSVLRATDESFTEQLLQRALDATKETKE